MSHLPHWIIVLSHLAFTLASPIYAPQFLSGGTGRNIRHLPCVSLRSGETGVCMFAFTCVKSNGTHLGTCIDRFYFGSCCKLNEDSDIYPQDNTIDGPSAASPFITTDSGLESNDIPDYFTRPKPISEKNPEISTLSTLGQTVASTKKTPTTSAATTTTTSATTTTTTTTEPPRIVTKRPTFFSTPYTTTQPPVGLSTFQTLHDYSHGSSTTFNNRRTSTSRPVTAQGSTSVESTTVTTPTVGSSSKPGSATTSGSSRPSVKPTVTKKPTSGLSAKPSGTRKPTIPSVTRPVTTTTTTTERTSTRFPPRNATTARPVQTTNTRRPVQHTTKRPTSVTKKPATGTRRPVTTARPPVVSTTKPTSVTDKTTSTSLKVTQTHRPPPLTSTQETLTTLGTRPSPTTAPTSTEVRPSQRPITKKPSTTIDDEKIITTARPTTSRPTVTSARPRPSVKPTRPSVATSGRPATLKTTPRPQQQTTERIKPSSSSSSTSPSTRPTTFRPVASSSVRPRPTEKPTKPSKPSKPPRPSSVPVSTTSTTSTTTHASTVTSSILNETTLANEILPPKVPASIATTETITSQPPGLVTWSSNSDEDVTKAPQISSTTSTTTHEASTEPEWSPITTPDGWIMIQSPTTEKAPIGAGDVTRPETTKVPTSSVKPSTGSSTTERPATTRPSLATTLSTIATVTTTTDLPLPIESLNMSDYKQVCGRRLFPESRIVGGDHSSFGKWPWQISLRQWRTSAYLHKCGAALLNENWAITAAHCVENVPPSDLLLRIGEHDLANEDEPYGFQERRVQIVASHPQFDPRTFEYDLALLRFYEPLQPFQPNLLPICLPDDDENYVGHTAYVTGWGRLYEDGPLPSVLQEVSVPVVNNTVCEGMYRNAGYIEHIPHIFICAGWRKGGFDSCEGDSGGPMVIQRPRDKRWILAGVISWGIGCAEPNQPGVYTRISEFREWINQILQF